MYDFGVLRALRKHARLALREVSEKAGVSIAVISKLERNQTSAELETLYRIARVFGMSATDLIALAESPLAHQKVESHYRSEGFDFRRITYQRAAIFIGNASAGAHVSRPEIHQDDYEICWVLEGSIRLRLPHESIVINRGESTQFDAVQAHTYEALEDTRLIILHLRKGKRF